MAYLTYKDDSGVHLTPVNYQKEETLIPSGKKVLATIENEPSNFIMGEARGFGDILFTAGSVEDLIKNYSDSFKDYLRNYGLGRFNLALMGETNRVIDMDKVNEIRAITKSRPYIGDIYVLNANSRLYHINSDAKILEKKLANFREHDSVRMRSPFGGEIIEIPNIFVKKDEHKDLSWLAPKLVEGKIPLEELEIKILTVGIAQTFGPYFYKPVVELKDGTTLSI